MMCTKKDEKIGKAAKQVISESTVSMTYSPSPEDDFLYTNKEIVASINRSWGRNETGQVRSQGGSHRICLIINLRTNRQSNIGILIK